MSDCDQQNIYFHNRQPAYQKKYDIKTYQHTCEFNPPSDGSPLSILIQQLTQDLFKMQAGEKRLTQFLDELPSVCSAIIKKIKHKKRLQIGKSAERGLILETFIIIFKELLGFLSFIDAHTTLHQRNADIYSGECKFHIKWEEGPSVNSKQYKFSSSQQTNEAFSQMVSSKRMVLMLSGTQGTSQNNSNLQQKSVSSSTLQQQGGLVQTYLQQFLKSQKEEISVLKGKNRTYYIVYLKQIMGKGGFGEVNRGQSLRLNKNNEMECETWAVKSCKKNINQYKQFGYSISQERQHEILLQINRALKKRQHKGGKYIIQLKEVIDQKDRKYIVYEYCKHNSLREMVKRRHAFNKKNIYEIALQMAEVMKLIHFDLMQTEEDFLNFSVKFSHDIEVRDDNTTFQKVVNRQSEAKGIIHRDIKLNNILVKQFSKQHIVIKLIDWAFSKRTYTNLKISRVSCGTAQYQAPEIEDKLKYNSKVDIWAFGAVVYELFTGRQLAEKGKGKEVKKNFMQYVQGIDFSQLNEKLPEGEVVFWKKLLMGTLDYNPDTRWNAIQVHSHLVSFQGYQPFQLKDLGPIVRLKQAKSVLIYHMSMAGGIVKPQKKLISKLFNHYSKLLVESVQFLAQRQIQRKIDLQAQQLELAKRQYKFIRQDQIVQSKAAYLRIKEAAIFFQEQLPLEYKDKDSLLSCIKFLAGEFQRQDHNGLSQ